MTGKLALHGGDPVITTPFVRYNTIGEEEIAAVTDVMRGGVLSAYIGAPGEAFMGGPQVRALEEEAARHFGVAHAVAVNSWTSGLIAAVGAIGLEPGDEVITTPWTMAATATAIVHWDGIPVFADIDPGTFNIAPAAVEAAVSPRTRAIIAVDIFGQSADMSALREIADRHSLRIISDTAQAPGALYKNRLAGTLADIGGYSLNYHKHIHCGEGGILVTDDARFARRLQLIRNHAEVVIDSDEPVELANMIGFNFRMGEIEAAIARTQLKKLKAKVEGRQTVAARLTEGLRSLPGLRLPVIAEGCTHVYYLYPIVLDPDRLGVDRDVVVAALEAEGVQGLSKGYQNLHLLPMYRHRIARGSGGFPWTSPSCRSAVRYGKGLCPVAEDLHERRLIFLCVCMYEFSDAEVDGVIAAFTKVWKNLEALRRS